MVESPGKILDRKALFLLMGLVALVFTGEVRAETAAPPAHHQGQDLGQAADDQSGPKNTIRFIIKALFPA